MAKSPIMAARRLADVLDLENAALKVMDLHRATTLLPEKAAAIAELTASREAAGALPHPDLLATAKRLDGLALENRRLLERAITAQRRVIGIVVRAAMTAAVGPAYGATGRQTNAARPMALSTRA